MTDEPWHGTISGYTNRRCRCPRCRGAMRTWQRGYRAGKRSRIGQPTPDLEFRVESRRGYKPQFFMWAISCIHTKNGQPATACVPIEDRSLPSLTRGREQATEAIQLLLRTQPPDQLLPEATDVGRRRL